MMNVSKEPSTCWACGGSINEEMVNCPSCDMPLSKTEADVDELDDFLSPQNSSEMTNEELSDLTPLPEEDMPAMPDFGEVQPDLPDFSAEQPTLPDLDEQPDLPDFADILEEGSEQKDMDLAFLDSVIDDPVKQPTDELLPDIPDFDSFDVSEESLKVQEISEVVTKNYAEMNLGKKIKLIGPQLIYWYIVFALISFAAYEIINQNLALSNQLYGRDFHYRPLYFPYSWIAFLALGFHVSFKFRKVGLEPKIKHLIGFILALFILVLIISGIFMLYYNPQYLTGNVIPKFYYVTSFFQFIIINYFVTLLSLGFVFAYLGFGPLYNAIYSITPEYQSENVKITG